MTEVRELAVQRAGQDRPGVSARDDELALWDHEFVTTVLNTAPCLIVVLDRDGRIVRFNQACSEHTGYAFEEVRGRAVWDLLIPAEQVEPVKGVFRRLVAEDRGAGDLHAYPHTYENEWVTKDGRRRSILWSNDCLRNDRGQIVAVIGTGLDITERKAIEEVLRASEARYRSLVEHASVCITELDLGGRITAMNAAGLRLLGLDDEREIVGRRSVDCVSEADRARLEAQLAGACAGESSELEVTTEYFARPLILFSSLIPVRGPDGAVHKIVSVTQDLTERKRAQTRLIEQESLARLGQMAAIFAHEIKNPLAGIRGALQIIGSRLPSEGREYVVLRDVVARLDSLSDLVQDVLTFAHPKRPRFAPVSLRALLENTLELARQDPVLAGLSVQVDGDSPTVNGDGAQLARVFLNLVLNAAQAMDGKGRIEVKVHAGDRRCDVFVKDAGPGIPTDIRHRLFEPFFTTKQRGTGLGLATAKRTVELHGGTIAVDSPPGGGAIVTVSLPTEGAGPPPVFGPA